MVGRRQPGSHTASVDQGIGTPVALGRQIVDLLALYQRGLNRNRVADTSSAIAGPVGRAHRQNYTVRMRHAKHPTDHFTNHPLAIIARAIHFFDLAILKAS